MAFNASSSSSSTVQCSLCRETLSGNGFRGIARLRCSHSFHLDCIGTEFNALGVMRCPNCGATEDGEWHYLESSNLGDMDENIQETEAHPSTEMEMLGVLMDQSLEQDQLWAHWEQGMMEQSDSITGDVFFGQSIFPVLPSTPVINQHFSIPWGDNFMVNSTGSLANGLPQTQVPFDVQQTILYPSFGAQHQLNNQTGSVAQDGRISASDGFQWSQPLVGLASVTTSSMLPNPFPPSGLPDGILGGHEAFLPEGTCGFCPLCPFCYP